MKSLLWVLSCVQVATALQWTSAGSLPHNATVPSCPGQDVTLAWNYSADPEEHLNNVEWHFKAQGGNETPVATRMMGSFFAAPKFTTHVQFIPNAGIRLHNVSVSDTGTYSVHVNLDVHGSIVREIQNAEVKVSDQPLTTDGQLHVKMLPQAVYDNSTQQYRVQLSCGDFLPVWSSKVAVLWKTPSNETLTSTSMDNGRFLLSVPNPVDSGEYTCVLDDRSAASLCVDSNSPLQRGVTYNMDGVQAQFLVMGAQMRSMQVKEERDNTDLRQQLETLRQENANLKTKLGIAARSVYFHAWGPALTGTRSHSLAVVFQHVTTNEGGAYNSNSGVFTVPVTGTYAMFLTIACNGTVSLEIDGTVVPENTARRDVNAFTQNVPVSFHWIMSLRHGQEVSVKMGYRTHVYHTGAFSGALLHAALP